MNIMLFKRERKIYKTGVNYRASKDPYFNMFLVNKELFIQPYYPANYRIPDCDFWDFIGGKRFFRIVILPRDTQINYYVYGDKSIVSFSNKIILSDEYCISDINIIRRFNIHITHYNILNICSIGATETLEYIKKNNLFPNALYDRYNVSYFDVASYYGHINVLDWLLNSGVNLKYSYTSIDNASKNGHVNVLNWWLKSNLPLKYTEKSLYWASKNGHVDVLTWWCKSNLPLKYDESALDSASWNGHINVLNWWFNSNLPLKYTNSAIDIASDKGYVEILNLWCCSGVELKYTDYQLIFASDNENFDILDWWINSGLPLKYPGYILVSASHKNNINVLEWWRKSGLLYKFDAKWIWKHYHIFSHCEMNILEWWMHNFYKDIPIKYKMYYNILWCKSKIVYRLY